VRARVHVCQVLGEGGLNCEMVQVLLMQQYAGAEGWGGGNS
jgi:hypothetical protein